MKIITLLIALIASQLIFAAGKFGPEWTFTNNELIREGRNLKRDGDKDRGNYLFLLKERLAKKFPDLKNDGYGKFEINDKYWFELTTDPWVIEVIASPMTAKQFKTHITKIQEVW